MYVKRIKFAHISLITKGHHPELFSQICVGAWLSVWLYAHFHVEYEYTFFWHGSLCKPLTVSPNKCMNMLPGLLIQGFNADQTT